jgi:1,4-alpha-glucan branching enzyme
MPASLCLILHAHLPFVRHPEHERFLEESWLFEAITETYLPFLEILEGWRCDAIPVRLTLSLSPTLCSMLQDPLLQERYLRHLESLITFAEHEIQRTLLDPQLQPLAILYHDRLSALRGLYLKLNRNPVQGFAAFQHTGQLEIITTSATHAVLPLIQQPGSIRAQVQTACEHHQSCFGRRPKGFWLPECAYAETVEPALKQAGIHWFIVESHGVLHSQPRPYYGLYAPIITSHQLFAMGRDQASARQLWSSQEGYPGDPRYRDFYRDAGFDLDLDYVKPYLPTDGARAYTGLKYYAITGSGQDKKPYNRAAALEAAAEHAEHFLQARCKQARHLAGILQKPPLLICPYDAELFGHWWYEGPEFLDAFVRKAATQKDLMLTTPTDYLAANPTHQAADPSPSSWGEGGYWNVWLNEKNAWIYSHLDAAQQRMAELAAKFRAANGSVQRALQQAGRELLLAQASDWPFILRTGSSPEYAADRIKNHLLRFNSLYDQLLANRIDETKLRELEQKDNLFPNLDFRYWRNA